MRADFIVKTQGSEEIGYKASVNTCNVANGIFGNFFIRVAMENMKNHSNFQFECPHKKSFIYLTNFPIIQLRDIPSFILAAYGKKIWKWQLTLVVKGKVSKKKQPFIHLSTVQFYGQGTL